MHEIYIQNRKQFPSMEHKTKEVKIDSRTSLYFHKYTLIVTLPYTYFEILKLLKILFIIFNGLFTIQTPLNLKPQKWPNERVEGAWSWVQSQAMP